MGEQCFGGDVFYDYQFGPVRYHFVFRSADYRIWRAYIDSVRSSGGNRYVVNRVKTQNACKQGDFNENKILQLLELFEAGEVEYRMLKQDKLSS